MLATGALAVSLTFIKEIASSTAQRRRHSSLTGSCQGRVASVASRSKASKALREIRRERPILKQHRSPAERIL